MTSRDNNHNDPLLSVIPETIGPDHIPILNRVLGKFFAQLRAARRHESLDQGRATAIGYALAMQSFLRSFAPASTEGLDLPPLNLANALLALNNNIVEPILKPTPRTGRAVHSPRRFALMGIAVGVVRRLELTGMPLKDANREVANKLTALGIRPARGSGQKINARTLRDWRERVSEVGPLVRRFLEDPRREMSAEDLGLINAAVNANDLMTAEWICRLQAMPPGDARRLILDALEQNIREMNLG